MAEAGRTRRGRMEILGDMIRLTAEGTGKTHIMFKANLSYAQTVQYLSELESMGFIQLTEDGRRYIITERGRRYLDSYEEMMRMMDHPLLFSFALPRIVAQRKHDRGPIWIWPDMPQHPQPQ